jgi:proteasome accessory factor C
VSSGASAQLARLLALLPWLRAHPGVTKAAAAQAFGISVDQLEKDLRLAFTCELPDRPEVFIDIDYLDSDRISVIDAASIDRPLRLRPDEAVALLVGLRALAAVPGLRDRASLDSALAKLEDAAGQAGLAAPPGEDTRAGVAARTDAAETVREGLDSGRRLHLRYWVPTRDEVTERDVDPLRIVVVDDVAYLEGWCHSSEAVRTFRFDRMAEVRVLDVPATPPPEADERSATEALGPGGVFRPSDADTVVTLGLSAEARWVPEYYACETVEEQANGGVVVTLRSTDSHLVERLVLRLGGEAEVLAPPEVKANVLRRAGNALANYGVSG